MHLSRRGTRVISPAKRMRIALREVSERRWPFHPLGTRYFCLLEEYGVLLFLLEEE